MSGEWGGGACTDVVVQVSVWLDAQVELCRCLKAVYITGGVV